MRKVAIAGIGQTPVKENWGAGLRELAVEVILKATDNANIQKPEALFLGNMLSGILSGQEHLATLVAEYAGLDGIEAVKCEAACGSAATAFRQAFLAVASGAVDSAIAAGVEKLTEMSGRSTTYGLATAADADYEASIGLSFVAINALLMRRYMHQYKYQKDDFAPFVINAHQNAIHNPCAMFRNPISAEHYQQAKMIADPVNLLDSSPIGDGAAAVVLCAADKVSQLPHPPIWVSACEVATDTIALDNRADPLWLKGVERSVSKALKTAGLEHQHIDFFEAHDAFSIMTALSLEASGFTEPGSALKLADKQQIAITGKLPLSTFGGLKGRGHPVGATGIYQIIEAVLQLQGKAPQPIQVENPKYAMAQNIGGSGATVITTILGKT